MATQSLTTRARGRIPAAAIATTKTYPESILAPLSDLSPRQLADEIGRVDALAKGIETALKSLKAEFVERGLTNVGGDDFVVTAVPQVTWRIDTATVRAHLGALVSKFERVSTTTVVRIKSARDHRLAVLAA